MTDQDRDKLGEIAGDINRTVRQIDPSGCNALSSLREALKRSIEMMRFCQHLLNQAASH